MHMPRQRKGAIAPLAAIIMVVMVGMVAFVVDVGYLNVVKTELQTAADSAATAGASALPDGPLASRWLAWRAGHANQAAGRAVLLVPAEDVELGYWNANTRHFNPLTGSDQLQANSVRVTCGCKESRGNAVSFSFARVFGEDSGDVAAVAVARRQVICGLFIGIESVDLNGNGAYTDSYDTRFGEYASQAPGENGHLCSNGPISVQNGNVHGDVRPGPGHSATVGSQGDITGTTDPLTEPIDVAPVRFGQVSWYNDNDELDSPPYYASKGRFKHNGGGITIPGGTYYFTDFSVTGGPVVINESVTIYVKGDFSVSGDGILNATHVPANLKIFAEGKSVKVAGSSDFHGFIYAPSSDIEVAGTASFYGGAIGKTLKFHNEGGIHADEALELLREAPTKSRLVQ